MGRNDPCSCGSGKKYKKCCGGSVSFALSTWIECVMHYC
ncbi:SEC-C metal-binding domain-containing protein [Methylomonas lenta]|nr:SEC-C metal-binding domain-containing protein [Methylomonas lenta]MDD2761053.1 SEC-C metal-binding domain-containing protein [Methylomonas sp.]